MTVKFTNLDLVRLKYCLSVAKERIRDEPPGFNDEIGASNRQMLDEIDRFASKIQKIITENRESSVHILK